MGRQIVRWWTGAGGLPSFRAVRRAAMALAAPALVLGLWAVTAPGGSGLVASGRIQSGHADLACADCHRPAAGTLRQQLQAQARWLVGLRPGPADVGRRAVGSDTCLDCHARPNERHPIFRFNEPRFADALQRVAANDCLRCHGEHDDAHRFRTTDLTFCAARHDGLRMKRDPLDVPHATLIAQDRWTTCLGCHDFHGNHRMQPPLMLSASLPTGKLEAYLRDGPDPYGQFRHFPARSGTEDRP